MVGVAQFLTGGGEMGARVQARDWSTSKLGPIKAWPQSLRTTLSIMLNSGFPTFLAWSQDLISFYNDAYMPILGTKPEGLGRPFPEVWSEAWETVGPIAARALAGERSYLEDLLIVIERNRSLQESWWTFSYSPVRGETGEVAGILCTVLETTERVLAERRLRFQVDLGKHLHGLVDPRAIMAAAAELLGRHLGQAVSAMVRSTRQASSSRSNAIGPMARCRASLGATASTTLARPSSPTCGPGARSASTTSCPTPARRATARPLPSLASACALGSQSR